MSSFKWFICIFVTLFIVFQAGDASFQANPRRNPGRSKINCPTIIVDKSGRGNFTTIGAAINAVPPGNQRWICIRVKEGEYREQVIIPFDKPFIILVGAGKRKTNVVWNGNDKITSATFISQADNIIAKCLSFINAYNYPLGSNKPIKPAVAAMIQGDKSAFYRVGFVGVQDTLWDVQGRHYFKQCTIQGLIDFIFGSGQSIYEACTISVVAQALNEGPGYITAQGRSTPTETNGFVFKDCTINGNGLAYLGRAWRAYARVLFYNTLMPNNIVPQGWDPWYSTGHEYGPVDFDEVNCRGLGSDVSRRVHWANKQSKIELVKLASLSYIDEGGWLSSYLSMDKLMRIKRN